jgi:hypothetical protein
MGRGPEETRVSIRVTHTDYLRNYGNSNTKLDAVTVLKKGLDVTGRVVDGNGQPVPDALALMGSTGLGRMIPKPRPMPKGGSSSKTAKPANRR